MGKNIIKFLFLFMSFTMNTELAKGMDCLLQKEATSEAVKLKMRNNSSSPVKITINYTLPNIQEKDILPVCPADVVCLKPLDSNIQDQKDINVPKQYGFVSVKVGNVLMFHSTMDLSSEILIGSKNEVFVDIIGSTTRSIPEWLFESLVVKKFDLEKYKQDLKSKWGKLTTEEKKDPYSYDIPSCLHAIDMTPTFTTVFPYCFDAELRRHALEQYIKQYPNVVVSDAAKQAAEDELVAFGVPLIKH